jgi:hypothetical protein
MSAPRSVTANFTTVVVDGQPPTVSIGAPADGATVSGTSVTVSADASDNGTVAGVQFKLNGQNLGAEDTSAPYSTSWNTTTVANGSYQLTAVARDAAGNTATSAAVNVSVNNPAPPPPSPVSGLKAAYSFDARSNPAKDDAGMGNAGTVSGATWTTTGRFCGAMSFDGINDRINIPDSNSLDLTTGMTLSAWVKPASLNGWTTIVLKERPGGLSYALYASDNTNRPPAGYVNLGGGDQGAIGANLLALNQWSHLTTTFDGQRLRLYVNGVLVRDRSIRGSILRSSRALRIGGNAIWGEYFKGLIDEVRVYSRALSASDVVSDMNRPVSSACPGGSDAVQ